MEWTWWKDWWRLKKWRQRNCTNRGRDNEDYGDDYDLDGDSDCCYCDECIVSLVIDIFNAFVCNCD